MGCQAASCETPLVSAAEEFPVQALGGLVEVHSKLVRRIERHVLERLLQAHVSCGMSFHALLPIQECNNFPGWRCHDCRVVASSAAAPIFSEHFLDVARQLRAMLPTE